MVQNSKVYSGAYAAIFNRYQYAYVDVSEKSIYSEAKFLLDSLPAEGSVIDSIFLLPVGWPGSGGHIAKIHVTSTGLGLWRVTPTEKFSRCTYAFKPNTWYKIAIKYDSTGYRAFINDAEVITDLVTSSPNVGVVVFGPISSNHRGNLYVDDVLITTSQTIPTVDETHIDPTPDETNVEDQTNQQTPSSTSNTDSGHLTGVGDDYLIYYNNGSPEVWDQDWIKTKFSQYNFKSVRLGFLFSDATGAGTAGWGSLYNYDKMDRVLDILSGSGVKGILLLQNNGISCKNYVGSWAWVNNWLSVTEQFKGDSRVSAFSIIGEPAHNDYYNTWATDGPLGPITDRRKLQQVFAYLIDRIHAIDPGRVVIYPVGHLNYGTGKEWCNELNSLGIPNKQNVVFDIMHPYYFENQWDMGLTPAQKAQWYVNNWIAPCVNFLGADRCFIGETFAWSLNRDLQIQFLTEIINAFVKYDVDFQVWAYWSSSIRSWQDQAIIVSTYN